MAPQSERIMDELVYTLIQQTYSPDSNLQERAARELGACDFEEHRLLAIQALCGLLKHDELFVREAAKSSLIQIDGTTVVDALIPYLKGQSTRALNYAVEILSRIGLSDIDRIVELLDSRDHDLRKFGCDLLGNLHYGESVYELIDLLSDPHINVAIAAGEALGKLGSREAVPRLLQALQYPDSWMRCIAAEALGKIGDARAADAFLRIPDAEEPMVLYTMIKAMGNLRDVRMVSMILSLLRRNAKFASSSVQALEQLLEQCGDTVYERLQEADARADVVSLLSSTSDNVVLTAIPLVEKLHYAEAVPILQGLRRHADDAIAAAAQSALKQIETQSPGQSET